MLKPRQATEWWVYIPAAVSFALLYVAVEMPFVPWIWLGILSGCTMVLDPSSPKFPYVRHGLLGILGFWTGVYLLLTYPRISLDNTVYFAALVMIFLSVVLLLLFTFKRSARIRDEFEQGK